MKLWIKNLSYKTLVATMITIVLSFFCVTSVSHAKLKLEDGQFYYSGTQEAEIRAEKSFWEIFKGILAEIVNYLLGIMTLGFRGVVVGWIEIMEIILTLILNADIDMGKLIINNDSTVTYSQEVVNVESIIFNRVPILNANIFE